MGVYFEWSNIRFESVQKVDQVTLDILVLMLSHVDTTHCTPRSDGPVRRQSMGVQDGPELGLTW